MGAQAVTKVTVAVEDRLHQDGCVWLDNPGIHIIETNVEGGGTGWGVVRERIQFPTLELSGHIF